MVGVSRAQEIHEKLTWERIKKILKGPVTWLTLASLIGVKLVSQVKSSSTTRLTDNVPDVVLAPIRTRVRNYPTAQRLSGGGIAFIPTPSRIRKATPSELSSIEANKPSMKEVIKEFEEIIKQELREKGLLQ